MAATAFVAIINRQTDPITTTVGDQICMQDGSGGSNLSYFNNLRIPPSETLPSSAGQKVVVKDWDTGLDNCVASDSKFTITVLGRTNIPIGSVSIFERYSDWWATSTDEALLKPDIAVGNSVVITVTVMPTGS